ncbi:EAL domain-containing protein [Sulfurimonas sp.]|uniref:EAL domain-containing protein n=1 Tax=Sulfurimonas sp. TaxID=2022749 RepID=UPI002605A6A9|nr:EAL domain-containing protein [Sulfurimonas sp.]MCW8894277.1 EAL domain-containing protein [Sulfurimonas sp.]MCW9067645.1 EAL domain-containing protein [Sulfurimonas sp.]
MTVYQSKRNTLILIIVVLALSWLMGYFYLKYQLNNSIAERFKDMSSSTQILFNLNLIHDKKILDIELDRIVVADNLPKAIADSDYEQIKSIISPLYMQLKSKEREIKILTFRSPEGVTLFRAHRPDFFGDLVNEERKLIVDTNKFKRSFSGFEIGKLEMTYRITKPIFYKSVYVGNVELGISPSRFIEDLNSIFKTDTGIVIDKSLSDIMLDKEMILVNDKYVLIDANENLKKHFQHKHDEEAEAYKIDMSIPLNNHISQTLGYLIVGFDVSGIVKSDKKFMGNLSYLIAIMVIIFGLILHKGFGAVLKLFSEQIYIDQLTGLKNREALKDALASDDRKVLFLSNIKEFSLLNDFYGVHVGNEILIQVANAFEKFALENEFSAFRISSDEYVLLRQDDNFDDKEYNVLIKKLHSDINSLKISIDGIDDYISVEIYSGIAYSDANTMEDAQMAIRRAKKQSLPYLMYSQHVDTKKFSQSVIEMKKTIKHALQHHNVLPYFQAITNRDGKTVKYEALMRIVEFNDGKKSILMPDSFLDIAMQSALYIDLEKEMLEKSLHFFANRDEKISVNFLPNDFFNPAVMNTLIDGIKSFDSPDRIVVEITEREGVDDFARLITVVEQLRRLGVQIAIDDFGSGYANYSHILKIKPDYIKIDGSLVKNIVTDEESKILVRSIVNFAKELNITTIAEFVENEDIYNLLKEYGVDEFQGYYFGRPEDLINA